MVSQGGISGRSIAVIFGGTVLAYSAIKGSTITKTLGYLLSGKTVPTTAPVTMTEGQPDSSNPGTRGDQSYHSTQAIGKLLAAPYGWSTGQEWTDLVALWNRESGWNPKIINRSSGAFGIAQALGHGGNGTAAQTSVEYTDGSIALVTVNEYPSELANAGDPTSQINWGLSYIKSTYGDPINAWAHEESQGWY